MTHLTSGNTSSRVLIIGIDGGTWRVLRPAIERGCMPYLASLVASGASGILRSTIPALTPAAWAAFQTGMNPGSTGVFSFASFDRNTHTRSFVSSRLLPPTIWEMASAAGKKVVSINVPLTYPPRAVNGAMVTGLLTPSTKSQFTYPAELAEELLREVPDYTIFSLDDFQQDSVLKQMPRFIDAMVCSAQSRTHAAQYLIAGHRPDHCMVHFQSSDQIQHALWPFLDPGGPLYDAAKHSCILERFYKPLDDCIRQIGEAFKAVHGPDYVTFIVSDHGFEAHMERFNLGTWLYKQGFLVPDRKVEHPPLLKRITRALRVGKIMRLFVSGKSVEKLEAMVTSPRQLADWSSSKALAISYSSEAGIYLLETDAEARRRTAEDILQQLRSLKADGSGRRIVQAVYRREEIYSGPCIEMMPDLVVVPGSGCTCDSHCYLDRPLLESVTDASCGHLGKHHTDGIIIAAGPVVAPTSKINADLVDAPATILYLLGIQLPAAMDGKVITDLLSKEFTASAGLPAIASGGPTTARSDQSQNEYSAQEDKDIQDRLRGLGYL